VYGGPLKAPQLRSFLDSYASQEPLPENAGQRQTVNDPLSQLAPVVVHSLSSSNLTDIEGQDDMWLIAFYATTGMQGHNAAVVLGWGGHGAESMGWVT